MDRGTILRKRAESDIAVFNDLVLTYVTTSVVILMSYTAAGEKFVEERIDGDMAIIRNEILKALRPVSLFLVGSFGRGEGSVFRHNKEMIPIRDYDILMVVGKKLPPKVLDGIKEGINARLGYRSMFNQASDLPLFAVSLVQLTEDELLHLNDLKVLELKLGSKILYGEDLRKKIRVSAEGLPFSSGTRFLFNSILGLVSVFETRYLENAPLSFEKLNLIYECGKMYVEIGTILALIGRIYKPKYSERSEMIRENYRRHFPFLVERIPDLDRKIEFFTRMKLFPENHIFEQFQPVELWFQTRKDLEHIFRFYLSQYLRTEPKNMVDFCDLCLEEMNTTYLDGVISFYMKQKYGFSSKSVVELANFTYRHVIGFKYLVRLMRQEGAVALGALRYFPILRIFTCAPLLLYSLKQDGTKDQTLFDAFKRRFNQIYPIRMSKNLGWDEAKTYLSRAYLLYSNCGGIL